MPLVSSQVLAGIRTFGLRALTDECTILRAWTGSDGGYRKAGQQTVATGVACRLMKQTRSDSTGVVADREAGRTYWKLAVAHDTDLRDGDAVVIDEVTYDVMQLFGVNTDKVFLEALLARIEEPAS